jgi:hypothetical protein
MQLRLQIIYFRFVQAGRRYCFGTLNRTTNCFNFLKLSVLSITVTRIKEINRYKIKLRLKLSQEMSSFFTGFQVLTTTKKDDISIKRNDNFKCTHKY